MIKNILILENVDFNIRKFVLTGINRGIKVYYLLLVHVNASTY